MKSGQAVITPTTPGSPPSRGAWIEMVNDVLRAAGLPSPPSRGAWIEIPFLRAPKGEIPSPPSRGAWIEIIHTGHASPCSTSVAPLAGGVD